MSYDPQGGGGTPPPDGGETRPTGGSDMPPTGGSDMSSTGGNETRAMGGGDMPSAGGQPTEPTGGYTPPPGGGYTPPPQSGGYGAPPPASGGYTPPPQGGGYAPPPQSGGYTPPPQSGYGAPPPPPPGSGYGAPQGGYGAPPPPPPQGSAAERGVTVGSMGTVNQASLQDLFQSWMAALTKPNVATYEAEIPKASWLRTLIGVAVVTLVSFIINLIFGAIAANSMNAYLSQLHAQGVYSMDWVANFGGGGGIAGAFIGLVFTAVFFFLGAGLLWLMARLFGGTNSDFMTHSYLLSISYTPLRVIGSIANIIPVLGGIISFAAMLYQLYSAGLAMQASQRMQPGRAQLAAFLPLIVGVLLFCLCIILAIFGLAAAINGASNR